MKKILLSLATIGVVGAIAAGATSAYFSDTETSAGNTFTAGTLNLNVDGKESTQVAHFTFSNISPGMSATSTYNLNNVGSIDGFANISGATVTDTKTLSNFIHVVATIGSTQVYSGSLSGLSAGLTKANFALANTTGTVPVTFVWTWPSTANDNNAQGGTASVDVTFALTQQAQ